jgi:PEP-CTERM motif
MFLKRLTQPLRERRMGRHFSGGLDMRIKTRQSINNLYRLIVISLLLTIGSAASATTYTYSGMPLTDFSGCFLSCPEVGLSGYVTFNFDTSKFSGTASLSSGDSAQLSEGSFPYISLSFPNVPPPVGAYAIVTFLSGDFTFIKGSITSWSLGGNTYAQNCQGGPACADGSSSISSTPTSDSINYFNEGSLNFASASNDGGGTWIEDPVSAVPEPSTWAMLLIGFVGIGLLTYRRRKSAVLAA